MFIYHIAMNRNALLLLLALCPHFEVVVHILRRSNEDGGAVMNADGLYVQDTFGSSSRLATSLLNNVSHWIALILESQLCMCVCVGEEVIRRMWENMTVCVCIQYVSFKGCNKLLVL